MDRVQRAKQFAPFDALKGLQDALRLAEYEHESVIKGELSEDDTMAISNVLRDINKGDIVEVEYFIDGHTFITTGAIKLMLDQYMIKVLDVKVPLSSIRKIKNLSI